MCSSSLNPLNLFRTGTVKARPLKLDVLNSPTLQFIRFSRGWPFPTTVGGRLSELQALRNFSQASCTGRPWLCSWDGGYVCFDAVRFGLLPYQAVLCFRIEDMSSTTQHKQPTRANRVGIKSNIAVCCFSIRYHYRLSCPVCTGCSRRTLFNSPVPSPVTLWLQAAVSPLLSSSAGPGKHDAFRGILRRCLVGAGPQHQPLERRPRSSQHNHQATCKEVHRLLHQVDQEPGSTHTPNWSTETNCVYNHQEHHPHVLPPRFRPAQPVPARPVLRFPAARHRAGDGASVACEPSCSFHL